MKTVFKKSLVMLAAAFAASLAFVSCSKDSITGTETVNASGESRVIAVAFSNNATKSVLDGLLPKFVAGDVIKVSNGTDTPQNCTVSVDGSGNATITTDLTGALTAVYPAAAAKMNGNVIEGILVSTVQDGSFASANICQATIAAGATSATFENRTAVFKITPAAGADTKYVEVFTAGAEIANSASGDYSAMTKIHVATTSADAVYVSILVPTGLQVKDLTFADGVNSKNKGSDTNLIALNTLYTVSGSSDSGWKKEYESVEIGGLKWATMNVGAEKETDCGYYFWWGLPEGYVYDSTNSKWFKASDGTELVDGIGDYPLYDSYTGNYTKYNSWGPFVLKPEDDPATVYLGSDWRTPTRDDLWALALSCGAINTEYGLQASINHTTNPSGASTSVDKGIYYCTSYDGVEGFLFSDGTNKLFFPADERNSSSETQCNINTSSMVNNNNNYGFISNIQLSVRFDTLKPDEIWYTTFSTQLYLRLSPITVRPVSGSLSE